MKKKKQSQVSKLIEFFKASGAINKSGAVEYASLNGILPEKELRYYIDNLSDGGYVIETDSRVWFNEQKWETDVRKTMKQYYGILLLSLAIPLLISLVLKSIF